MSFHISDVATHASHPITADFNITSFLYLSIVPCKLIVPSSIKIGFPFFILRLAGLISPHPNVSISNFPISSHQYFLSTFFTSAIFTFLPLISATSATNASIIFLSADFKLL